MKRLREEPWTPVVAPPAKQLRLERSLTVSFRGRAPEPLATSSAATTSVKRLREELPRTSSPAPKAKMLRMETVGGRPRSPVGSGGLVRDAGVLPKLGVGTLTKIPADKARRLRSARKTEEADGIESLPGRTRLETLMVKAPTRRQYFKVLWLLACWAMGVSLKVAEGSDTVSYQESLIERCPSALMLV